MALVQGVGHVREPSSRLLHRALVCRWVGVREAVSECEIGSDRSGCAIMLEGSQGNGSRDERRDADGTADRLRVPWSRALRPALGYYVSMDPKA